MKEITLQIPDNMCPDKVREMHGCLLRFFEPKEEPKFKRGDIIFASDHNSRFEAICIIREIKNETNGCYYYVMLNTISSDLYLNDSMANNIKEKRLATPEERQLLFTALAKEGKRWNAETLELEDILRVPENIKLYQPKKNNDQIYIGFGDRQLLGVFNGVWHVMIDDIDQPYKPVKCELIPCKREDLKAGDTAFMGNKGDTTKMDVNELESYCKIISKELYVRIAYGTDAEVYNDNLKYLWYKVVPIKE